LLRRREHIRFEALAEVPAEPSSSDPSKDVAGEQLRKALTFEHRIADTRRVDRERFEPADSKRLRRRKAMFAAVCVQTVFCAVILGYLLLSDTARMDAQLRYWLSVDQSKSLLVSVRPRMDGQVRVRGVSENFDSVMSPESFFLGHKWKPTVARDPVTRDVTGLYGLLLFVSGVMSVAFGVALRREARFRDLLATSVGESPTK
jgi:hypothetical protein